MKFLISRANISFWRTLISWI